MLETEDKDSDTTSNVHEHIVHDEYRIESNQKGDSSYQEPTEFILKSLSFIYCDVFKIVPEVTEEIERVNTDKDNKLIEDLKTIRLGSLKWLHLRQVQEHYNLHAYHTDNLQAWIF